MTEMWPCLRRCKAVEEWTAEGVCQQSCAVHGHLLSLSPDPGKPHDSIKTDLENSWSAHLHEVIREYDT